MDFNDKEIAFLLSPHKVETADKGIRSIAGAPDLRQIGCPVGIFTRVLERRAAKLGPVFREFRSSQQQRVQVPDSDALDLSQMIRASRLF